MKMRFIDALVREIKDKITEITDRRADRIIRAIDSAIDSVKDSADEAREKAYNLMLSLVDSSGREQRDQLQEIILNYGIQMEEIERCEHYVKYFEQLKTELLKEVEVKE